MPNSHIPDKIKKSIIISNKFITSEDLASEFNIKKRTCKSSHPQRNKSSHPQRNQPYF
ncbi:hypothetical protein LCGC14_0824560 [marine sediment metagenome]|uniref:Helix-turn-helix type 11 domain-containing protein n=1 Tax=marine sediment metagenome TaxID=412755 RepID=A0A0F9S2N0_9ZZZZ